MNPNTKDNLIAAAVWTALIAAAFCAVYFGGGAIAHTQKGEGQQSGVVVAVDHGGLIWKTTTVFIKTDQYASDTDTYCVSDPAVRAQLRAAVESGQKVIIRYTEHIGWSKGCQWTGTETIRSVEVV